MMTRLTTRGHLRPKRSEMTPKITYATDWMVRNQLNVDIVGAKRMGKVLYIIEDCSPGLACDTSPLTQNLPHTAKTRGTESTCVKGCGKFLPRSCASFLVSRRTKIERMQLTAPAERNSKVNVIAVVFIDLESESSSEQRRRS